MNKAFTRESDNEADDEAPGLPPLPPGTRNYITPAGYAALRAELLALIDAHALLREASSQTDRLSGELRRRLIVLADRLAELLTASGFPPNNGGN